MGAAIVRSGVTVERSENVWEDSPNTGLLAEESV